MPELSPSFPDAPHAGGASLIGKQNVGDQSPHGLSNSHHFVSSHYPVDLFFRNLSVAEPNLHGLIESEVFVGGEEENFLPDEHCHGNGITPSSLVISYHKDGFLHSLNSVKEDVEAEAAEEETLSGNYHSLDYLGLTFGPSSLSSSVMSSTSLDEQMNTERESHDAVANRLEQLHRSDSYKKYNSCKGNNASGFHTDLKCIVKIGRNYNRNMSPISTRSSPRCIKASAPNSSIIGTSLKEEFTCDRNGCKGTPHKALYLITDRTKTFSDKKAPVWHNPSKSDKLLTTSKKDTGPINQLKREGSCRSKSEAREGIVNTENKFSSLPRKKKEKTDKDIAAETYGTLGKNRKPKICNDISTSFHADKIQSNINISKELPSESKNILDKYATLPRRKAKEISARWRDQVGSKDVKDIRPPLQRSKSTGKGEYNRPIRVSPSNSACLSSSSAQSSRISNNPSNKVNKLKIKMCSPSAKLIARQGPISKEKMDKSPSPGIYGNGRQLKLSKITKKNVEVQVNIKWDPNESELQEKLRMLTEEFSILQKRLTRAESTADEVEQLRMEAVNLRSTAETERMEKEELQDELDRTSEKVREMLTSMEGVEKEFNCRGDSLIELENQLQNSTEININIQEKLNQYEDHTVKLKKDLEKSLVAQKILLQQVQDLEAEGREMVEFMAEEKNALSECLRESEMEANRNKMEIEKLTCKLQQKDEEARHMVRLAEERRLDYISIQSEMRSMQLNTQDLMVCQGADVTGASVGLGNLAARLQILTGKLVQDYSISENDIENVVTPVDSDSSISSANGTPELQKSPIRSANRSASPRKPVSFMQSFLNAMRSAQNTSKLLTATLKTASIKIAASDSTSLNSANGSENLPGVLVDPPNSISQSLADQVTEIDSLITRFLKVCCVLKCDADNILSELEDENERLCSQIQLQQQMIDQQYADFESLSTFESNARKELKLISKDLEIANDTLNKVCDDDSKLQAKKVEDELAKIHLTLHRLEKLHVEKQDIMTHTLQSMSNEHSTKLDSHHLSVNPCQYTSLDKHQRLTKPKVMCYSCKNKALRREVVDHDLDYFKLSNGNSSIHHDHSCNNESVVDVSEEKLPEIDFLVNHILKTLETVPDVISSSPTLKNLYLQLNTSGPFEVCPSPIKNSSAPPISGAVPSSSLIQEHLKDVATQENEHHSIEYFSRNVEIQTVNDNDKLSIIDRNIEKTKNKEITSETSSIIDKPNMVNSSTSNFVSESSMTLYENMQKLTLNTSDTIENLYNTLESNHDSQCYSKIEISENSLNNCKSVKDSFNDSLSNSSHIASCNSNTNDNLDIRVGYVSVSTNTISTSTVATNTESPDSICKEDLPETENKESNAYTTNISIDCNANPEITIVASSPDPCKFIPLLTHETSL